VTRIVTMALARGLHWCIMDVKIF